jgi:hypothetical protein
MYRAARAVESFNKKFKPGEIVLARTREGMKRTRILAAAFNAGFARPVVDLEELGLTELYLVYPLKED